MGIADHMLPLGDWFPYKNVRIQMLKSLKIPPAAQDDFFVYFAWKIV